MKNQIIIVEGKADKYKILSIYPNANILVSNGFSFNDAFLNKIKLLKKYNEIIIFTDPDWSGENIRKRISKFIDNDCKHAYINPKLITKKKKGVAEANNEQIKFALNNLLTININNKNSITWEEFLHNDLFLKEKKDKICDFYGLNSNINNKNFFKMLNYLNLDSLKLNELLTKKDINA